MKKVQMFKMEGCPYCAKAFRLIREIQKKEPELRDVDIEVIDEKQQPEIADRYDYWYVPTFYVDGEKLLEGDPSAAQVEHVLRAAAE